MGYKFLEREEKMNAEGHKKKAEEIKRKGLDQGQFWLMQRNLMKLKKFLIDLTLDT